MTRHPRAARPVRALLLATALGLLGPGAILAVEAPQPTTEPTAAPTVEPTAAPTAEPTAPPLASAASILIAVFDSQSTADPDDDTLLDAGVFAVHLDDGDGIFEPAADALVFGPAEANGGLLDTADLPAGRYWIVQTATPAGYRPAAPVLAELNLDSTVTCLWDATGPLECHVNDVGAEDLSWTIAVVVNDPLPSATVAPTEAPEPTAAGTGGVEGATGTPAVTLPPTDGSEALTGPSTEAGGRMALAILAVVAGLAVLLNGRRRQARLQATGQRGRE
jgi:hypothetical protein